MEESQKRDASSVNARNSISSLDEDFGKDFLSSWKLSKSGKDTIDFDVESVPRSSKKFSFDKLDDFELDGAFGKLSSFKMDVSDLDFSSPLKKTVKSNESTGHELSEVQKGPKKDSFSFTFDFNELGKFNLDPNLAIGEEDTSKFTAKLDSSCSAKDKDRQGHSETGNCIVEGTKIKEAQKIQGVSTVGPAHTTGQEILRSVSHSTSSTNSADSSGKMHQTFTKINPPRMEQNKMDKEIRNERGEHPDRACLTNPVVKTSAQEFSFRSPPTDYAAQATAAPENCKRAIIVDPMNVSLSRERDNCDQSTRSSQSRSDSPVNSCNSGRLVSQSESPTDRNEVESGSHNEVSHGKQGVRSTSSKLLEKGLYGAKDIEVDCSGPKNFPSSMLREIRNDKSTSVNEKGSSSLLCKSFCTKNNALPQLTSAPSSNQQCMTNNTNIGKVNLHPADLIREHKQANGPAENSKVGLSKSQKKPTLQGLSTASVNGKDDKNNKLSFELPPAGLPVLGIPCSIAHSTGHNIASSCASLKLTKTPVKVQGSSSKDEKRITSLRLIGPRDAKADSKSPSSLLLLDRKSLDVSGSKDFPVAATPNMPNSTSDGKYALLSPSLKRKIPEESLQEPKAPKPLKRMMSSLAVRKSPKSSPKMANQTVLGNGSPKARTCNVVSPSVLHEMGDIADLELPVLAETDGNVEKAEACRKDLEDMCSMLKRKHEEAKELVVRAIVNNNMMLMLNHPMFNEKISALKKILSSREHLL